MGAVLVGYHEGGELRYGGKVGTGFGSADLAELNKRLRPSVRRTSPFRSGRPPAGATFVTPRLVCECAFAEWTRDGLVRQASFLGLREDKPAEDVRRERPA